MEIKLHKFRAKTHEECELDIAVGDHVRSFDYEGRHDCYIEGIVCDVDYELNGCPRYVIEAEKRFVLGEDRSIGEPNRRFYPPMNGVRNALGGYCNGVTKL